MYSTYNGAKKCAKELNRLFKDSGFIYPLNECQHAIARAGGYSNWHDLQSSLRSSTLSIDKFVARKRLLMTLPSPCCPPAVAWLDNELTDNSPISEMPPHWWRYVFPYLMATVSVHRGRTALIRPGSGSGQTLRERLAIGLLLNQGANSVPRFDPVTFSFHFSGVLEELFHADFQHPRFKTELDTLTAGGVLEVRQDEVIVLTPSAQMVAGRVAKEKIEKAKYWSGKTSHEAVLALGDALAIIGVRNSLRVADAICRFGSNAFITPSGPALDLLSELADEGDLETFSRVYGLFSSVQPMCTRTLSESLAAKISSRYFSCHLRLDAKRILAWAAKNPDWPDQLKSAITEPSYFVHTVDRMANAISDSA